MEGPSVTGCAAPGRQAPGGAWDCSFVVLRFHGLSGLSRSAQTRASRSCAGSRPCTIDGAAGSRAPPQLWLVAMSLLSLKSPSALLSGFPARREQRTLSWLEPPTEGEGSWHRGDRAPGTSREGIQQLRG